MKAITLIQNEVKLIVIKLTELQDELAIKQERSMFE